MLMLLLGDGVMWTLSVLPMLAAGNTDDIYTLTTPTGWVNVIYYWCLKIKCF
jgi:hypothetical protein